MGGNGEVTKLGDILTLVLVLLYIVYSRHVYCYDTCMMQSVIIYQSLNASKIKFQYAKEHAIFRLTKDRRRRRRRWRHLESGLQQLPYR